MKKSILLAVTICTLQMAAFSQKPWIGFQAGGSFSGMVLKSNSEKAASQLLPGFTTGVLIDWSVSKHISIQPAINFVQKGGLIKYSGSYSGEEFETKLEYLEIPANVIFYSKPAKMGFFAGGGVNLGIGLSGYKTITNAPYLGWLLDEVEEVKFGNSADDHMKSFEVGMNLLIGYSCKPGLFFSVTGNFGLNNLSNNSGSTIRNNYVALKVGWLIRRKA